MLTHSKEWKGVRRMPQVDINYLAVLVATVAAMVIGAIWYAPKVLGNLWMKELGMGATPEDREKMRKGAAKAYAGMFIAALVTSYVLAHFVDYTNATTALNGAVTALWLWLGFVATVIFGQVLFEKRSLTLFAIGAGYQLVNLVVMGIILAVWR